MKKRLFISVVLAVVLLAYGTMAWSLDFSKEEYAARRQKLMDQIPDGVAILWGAQLPGSYMEYYQNNDFMYFTGVELPNAILIMDGTTGESTLFFTSSIRAARNEGVPANLIESPEAYTGIEHFRPFEDFSRVIEGLSRKVKIFYTPFKPAEGMRECTLETFRMLQKNMTTHPWDGRLTRELQFVRNLKERFPEVPVKACDPMIWKLRIIKSQAEIDLIREAARIAVKAHKEMLKTVRVGMSEAEVAALYEYYCKKEGAQNLAFYCIISSGENHPYFHYYKHDRILEDGDILVVDVGPDYHYYDIDISISFPANGIFSPRQKEVYEACNAVHEANMKVYRPGLNEEECRSEVNEILEKQGFDLTKDYFQRMRGGFGHYVGMAVHDVGRRPEVLQPGMVIANEPLWIYPDEEIGVRVEDTILITEYGCENLTAGIPRTVKEIEAHMKKDGVIQILKKAKIY